ncbi:MAG: hypothetical protein OEZ48_13975 [Candidatus Bathyarchaeota archaeon]|nr:hypothetical protein [Candidatus Bathyarchaeota archaeon]
MAAVARTIEKDAKPTKSTSNVGYCTAPNAACLNASTGFCDLEEIWEKVYVN